MSFPQAERERRISEALAAHDPAQQATTEVPWRGGKQLLAVVELDLEATVLNPRSHRIRSQLESDPRANIVNDKPFSEDAQETVRDILRQSENYDDLKRNIDEDGQQTPGLVTASGLLVNANRRAVALGDLGREYITVAVLPADASDGEISVLELSLQMQEDFRVDYSYTNRLLFVAELIKEQNKAARDVARALNLASSSQPAALKRGTAQVEQDLRVLSMIRQVQRRSDDQIPLTDFDEQEVALEELDNRYRELQASNPKHAEQLFELRLLGVLTMVPYRDIRLLEADAIERQVIPLMSEDELLGDSVVALSHSSAREDGRDDPAGLELLEEGALAGTPVVTPLVDLLASSRAEDEVELPLADGSRTVARDSLVEAVKDVLRSAAQERRNNRRVEDRLHAPTNMVLEAERKLREAREALADVVEEPAFDVERLREALEGAREQIRELARAAGEDPD